MTDKEIIIDGKECRYWFRPNPSDYRKCSLRGKNDNCDEINDCFIKELLDKLARKEQECKELEKEKVEIKKYLGISHKTILERLEELTDFRDRDRDELDQLKTENVRMLKQLEFVRTLNTVQEAENRKLKQTIAKIKGICSEMNCESLMQNS